MQTATEAHTAALQAKGVKPSPDESRRHRLASNAMQALVAKYGALSTTTRETEQIATVAYMFADAMLVVGARK